MRIEFSMRMHVSSPKVPNARAMQCIPKKWHLIYFQMLWAIPNRISSDWEVELIKIGIKILDKFVTHHKSRIRSTSIINPFTRITREMFNQGITSWKGFRDPHIHTWGYNAVELHKVKLLVQPTSKTNQTWLHKLGVPYEYYTRTAQNFITNMPTS
jgi:hypothetical protein